MIPECRTPHDTENILFLHTHDYMYNVHVHISCLHFLINVVQLKYTLATLLMNQILYVHVDLYNVILDKPAHS